jgi:hypothetical protein
MIESQPRALDRMMSKKTRIAWVVAFAGLAFFGQTPALSQAQASARQGLGEPRASIMESLLRSVYPRKSFKWDPGLMLEVTPGHFQKIQFPGLVLKAFDSTTLHGATGLEIGDDKALFIFESRRTTQASHPPFVTMLVVFDATTEGRITQFKKFSLESAEGASEIKLLHLQDAASTGWPLLQVQYMSYYGVSGRQFQIEWQASFDPNNEKFISRLPAAIVVRSPEGEEDFEILQVRRVDSTTISITDSVTDKTVRYECGDPCVVTGAALVKLWAP